MTAQMPELLNPRLLVAARALPYPATPDVAAAVRRRLRESRDRGRPMAPARRLAWALAAVLLLVAGLMAVPQVRAAVVEVLRIGVVRIFLGPTPTEPVVPTSTEEPAVSPALLLTASPAEAPAAALPTEPQATARPTPTPRPSPTPLSSILDLAGETTLAEARSLSGFPIGLPTYPADLGEPDRVFYQDQGGPVVVLVWLVPGQPDQVQLSLQLLSSKSWGTSKLQPRTVQETTVGDRPAVWAEGPYMMIFRNGNAGATRLIEGHVLIWEDDGITYRLETGESLDEAVRIAESLK